VLLARRERGIDELDELMRAISFHELTNQHTTMVKDRPAENFGREFIAEYFGWLPNDIRKRVRQRRRPWTKGRRGVQLQRSLVPEPNEALLNFGIRLLPVADGPGVDGVSNSPGCLEGSRGLAHLRSVGHLFRCRSLRVSSAT
jgi:hypothetical protein